MYCVDQLCKYVLFKTRHSNVLVVAGRGWAWSGAAAEGTVVEATVPARGVPSAVAQFERIVFFTHIYGGRALGKRMPNERHVLNSLCIENPLHQFITSGEFSLRSKGNQQVTVLKLPHPNEVYIFSWRTPSFLQTIVVP